jgi:hypothetical protein
MTIGTKCELGGFLQFKTEVRGHVQVTPLTRLVFDRHHGYATTMSKDPLIFRKNDWCEA